MAQTPSGYLLGRPLIQSSLIIEKAHFSAAVPHTTRSTKCKRHFLLLQGLIWCCTDVIVFTMGPLILFNLQQTGAELTAGCLSAAAASMSPTVVAFPKPYKPYKPQAPFPCPTASAPGCDLSVGHSQAGFHAAQRERWRRPHEPPQAGHSVHLYCMQINESCPSWVCFRRLLEHETGQQKHQFVFSGCYSLWVRRICIKRYKSGDVKWGGEKKHRVLPSSIFRVLYSCFSLLLCIN